MAQQQEDDWFVRTLTETVYVFKGPFFDGPLVWFLRRRFHNLQPNDVDEIAAQTGLLALERRETFNKDRGTLLQWLCAIAQHTAFDLFQERKLSRQVSLQLNAGELDAYDHRTWVRGRDAADFSLSEEEKSELHEVLQQHLSEQEYHALRAWARSKGEDWASELARETGKSSNVWRNAKARVMRKRDELKDALPTVPSGWGANDKGGRR
jgi:DNA-directed RNA polymerase specialized sigma24 family protein